MRANNLSFLTLVDSEIVWENNFTTNCYLSVKINQKHASFGLSKSQYSKLTHIWTGFGTDFVHNSTQFMKIIDIVDIVLFSSNTKELSLICFLMLQIPIIMYM